MLFLDFRILDALDILLVAFLLYQLYRLVRGTVAINIFIGVAAIYLIWKLVDALQMALLTEILGKFIGVGVIALVIVFQQEIRKFLLLLGSTNLTGRKRFLRQWKWLKEEDKNQIELDEIVEACLSMAATRTGAILIIENQSALNAVCDTGTTVKAKTSSPLLESIFNKHSPLHDGAVVINGETIKAAGCILPLTEQAALPSRFGLRHRAALGITEKTDAVALVVSEETGGISFIKNNHFESNLSAKELRHFLENLGED